MTSSFERKRRERQRQLALEAQQRRRPVSVMQPTDKPNQYQITLLGLPDPPQHYYCNTAHVLRHPTFVTFVFGQFGVDGKMLQNAITIDIPYAGVRAIVGTLDKAFRDLLTQSTKGFKELEKSIIGPPVPTVSYLGQVARLTVSDFGGVLDFYELIPIAGKAPAVEPVIRIKALPQVVKYVADECDQIVRQLPPQNIETPDLPLEPSETRKP